MEEGFLNRWGPAGNHSLIGIQVEVLQGNRIGNKATRGLPEMRISAEN
ncbi:MAG: hypothetical protein AAF550_09570 [Myxococcota bacterium]